MNGFTKYITECPWEDIVTTWFVLVEDTYQRIVAKRGQPFRASGPAPSFTDSEVITVSLIIETFFHGNEELGYAFVYQYMLDMFPRLLDLDRFNARRRKLVGVMEAIRCDLRDQKMNRADTVRLVDSAPVTVVTYTRGSRCRSVVGNEHFGVVTSKKGKVYGFRLHATVAADQLIDQWVLAPASIPDPQVLDELVLDERNLVLIGDKIYNDTELEDRLWRKRGTLLLPLRKDNQKKQWPEGVQEALGRIRHRVETVFSVLTTVFNVERPRGRTFAGYVVRVATCILAHTLCFFLA
ncbi:MAG: IS982 family transposase [Chloroflexota bacterium]